MIFNDSIFQGLSFFTLGFLCLTAMISFVLNCYFKNRAFSYYLSYVVLTILFVITVLLLQENNNDTDSNGDRITPIIYDILRVVVFYFHSLFVYKSMVIENKKLKKLAWLMNIYTGIVGLRIISAIINPYFMDDNPVFLGMSRMLIVSICLILYYYLYKEIANAYLRFIFMASTLLIAFVLMTMIDSFLNNHNSTLRGFMFFCIGVILENVCFVSAFIFQIVTIEKYLKHTETTHKEQLSVVKLEMQQLTMQNIGREIHDNVGQKLTLASLYTQQLEYENKAPLVIKTIESISELINHSLNELRQLSKSLTNDTIDNNTLPDLLKLECERFKDLKQCNIIFNNNSKSHLLGYQSKSVLLRITQEFIQNSIKHSNCKNIEISISNSVKKLNISLEDDGSGFDSKKEATTGMGLINMKNRIQIIGGRYSLESDSNNGTKLLLEIPL